MKETQGYLWVSIVAFFVGAIGACGQAYLVYHELADCLPFKVVDADFYRTIARVGIWLAPLIAVVVGILFVRKRFWFSLVLPVLLTPVVFAGIYKTFHVVYGLNTIVEPVAWGDFTTARAAERFYAYCVSLAFTGFIIGAILALLLWFITKPRKLA